MGDKSETMNMPALKEPTEGSSEKALYLKALEKAQAEGGTNFRTDTFRSLTETPKLSEGERIVYEWTTSEDDMEGAEVGERSTSENTVLIATFPKIERE